MSAHGGAVALPAGGTLHCLRNSIIHATPSFGSAPPVGSE